MSGWWSKLFSGARRVELFSLAFLLLVNLAGVFIFYLDPSLFRDRYVVESGPVETLTVVFLIAGAISSFVLGQRNLKRRGWRQAVFPFGCALLMLFVAGEELSWGQHALDFHSPEFFNLNNTQGETNLHNLRLGGVKLNKIIFADLVGIGVFVYMVGLPFFCGRSQVFGLCCRRWGLAVPAWRHALILLLVLGLGELIRDDRRSELDELSVVVVFFLTLLPPKERR
jgi:hypothetical protein